VGTTNLKIARLTLAGAVAAGVLGIASAQAATANIEQLHRSWRAAIAHTAAPGKGCFTAEYPLTVWKEVACTTAPNVPYLPRSGAGSGQTTGDGNDYAAVTATLTSSVTGSFPKVKGLTSETDGGRQNVYSLQLNSNFMSNDQACSGAVNPASCLGWEQFVYSSSEHQAFMQYWLIHYTGTGVSCPAGWNSFSTDCWKNSNGVSVPQEPITDLSKITLSGTGVAGGIDTINFTDDTHSYSVTGQDSVMFLAAGWMGSEFNVIGDGGGSQANFNAGTKLTVRMDVTDGSLAAPVCQADDGTTGETNNLNLGACKAKKGKGAKLPSVQFVESLPKN
jgi:hypothetical protein